MKITRLVVLVVGIVLVLTGLSLGVGGAGVLLAVAAGSDEDGYLTTPSVELTTETYAITGGELELTDPPASWTPWGDGLDVRVSVTSAERPVFVGIGREADVAAYLEDVRHTEVRRLELPDPDLVDRDGAEQPVTPSDLTFWAASTEGAGTQTLSWTAEAGSWTVVIMNADATPGIDLEATAGVRTDVLLPIGIGLLVGALVLLGLGAALIVAAIATQQPTPPAGPTGPADAGSVPVDARAHPVVLLGHLDPQVSRWQWLVKWLLLVPHVVVLAFLYVAFLLMTLVAGVAILFTGRYPRGLFTFNLGVLRWGWRVGFYGYSALGTDRYPPFSLSPADYPADLDVTYPARLSRGLVLVKWWLLAIPHYLILAVLTGGAATWSFQVSSESSWQLALGGGLLGILVLVAAIALLFTGRYPGGLFDLVMGLNRWVYRVVAYVALMTDTYPPFRLDVGGSEPGAVPPPPSGPPAGSEAELVRH